MPFTPTHILAILPIAALRRLRLPFSALVIGGMIPDFPLFVPLSPIYATTHSVAGLFTACLPLGMACFLLFQLFLKRPLFALLPSSIQARCVSLLKPFAWTSARAFALASIAVVIGASTHVLWDSFTHRGRWGTRLFPGLDETAMILRGQAIPGYKLLQYGSSLIGLPCLALLLATWLSRREPQPLRGHPDLLRSAKVAAGLLMIAVPALVAVLAVYRDDSHRYDRLGRTITVSGLVLMVMTLAYCLAFLAIERWRAGRGRDPLA